MKKLIIQPSFGLIFNVFDVAVSTRICRLSFIDIDHNIFEDNYLFDELNTLSDESYFFIEPAITLRGGWKNIKMQFQFARIAHLNNPEWHIGEELHFSAGIYFTLAKKYL